MSKISKACGEPSFEKESDDYPVVILPNGNLVLNPNDLSWSIQGSVSPLELAKAQEITAGFHYSPSDDNPGYQLVQMVAKALEGHAYQREKPSTPVEEDTSDIELLIDCWEDFN